MESCVPQGSVLGPNLYCKYTIPMYLIIKIFLILYHMYADDSQLYKVIASYVREHQLQSVAQLQDCIAEISDWMDWNRLKLNEDKTELLIVGNVGDVNVKSSLCVRNLGVLIDSELTMKTIKFVFLCISHWMEIVRSI